MTPENPPETIRVGKGRRRKPQMVALMSLSQGQTYVHEHRDTKTGQPMKTSFAGWLAIQRQRFNKNFQGKRIADLLPPEGTDGPVVARYEISVIPFDPNRKTRKKGEIAVPEAPPEPQAEPRELAHVTVTVDVAVKEGDNRASSVTVVNPTASTDIPAEVLSQTSV